ncbi:hypothetical protein COOONC_24182, partial [Cooperia oncophora]
LSKNEDLVRVQFDLLLKCPDEISDGTVRVVSEGASLLSLVVVLVLRTTTRASQLLSVVPQSACDECVSGCRTSPSDMVGFRIPDHGQVIQGADSQSDRIRIRFLPTSLSPSVERRLCQMEAPLRHSQFPGWPCDATRVIEYGWRIAKKLEWETIAQSVQYGQEHGRIVVVVPEVLHRIKFCHTSPNMAIFYYKSFREIRATNTAIFADDVGNVILVLPPREPADPYSWLQFVNALNLWLSCGAHVIIVNGPRAVEENSWDRLNAKTRSHINGYVDTYPSFLNQIHCLVPAEPGILSSTMACLKVGVVHNPDRWWPVEQAVEFFEFSEGLREARLCKDSENHEAERKSVGSKKRSVVWKAVIKVGRISKRHLKRVEKRKLRSLERATEKKLEQLKM